jgi:hypothetical protein
MITVEKKHFFTGGLSTEVSSKRFWCMVSTAKDGIFKRETTFVFEVKGKGRLPSDYKPMVKILYEPSLSKQARLEWHGRIVRFLDGLTSREDIANVDDAVSTLHGHLITEDGIEAVACVDIWAGS